MSFYLKEIQDQLKTMSFKPSPVKRVRIPKPSAAERALGIPTGIDRIVQQPILQIIVPFFDPDFSDQSFGFRKGKSAHQAVKSPQIFVKDAKNVTLSTAIPARQEI